MKSIYFKAKYFIGTDGRLNGSGLTVQGPGFRDRGSGFSSANISTLNPEP